jgi:hypothetical protein
LPVSQPCLEGRWPGLCDKAQDFLICGKRRRGAILKASRCKFKVQEHLRARARPELRGEKSLLASGEDANDGSGRHLRFGEMTMTD